MVVEPKRAAGARGAFVRPFVHQSNAQTVPTHRLVVLSRQVLPEDERVGADEAAHRRDALDPDAVLVDRDGPGQVPGLVVQALPKAPAFPVPAIARVGPEDQQEAERGAQQRVDPGGDGLQVEELEEELAGFGLCGGWVNRVRLLDGWRKRRGKEKRAALCVRVCERAQTTHRDHERPDHVGDDGHPDALQHLFVCVLGWGE